MAGKYKHLPQFRLPEVVYFVTWCLADRNDELLPQEREIVAKTITLWHEDRYRLAAYVVMDDHVHVMVLPLPPNELGQILHSWKGYTSKAINGLRGTRGKRWQKSSYTEIMRNEREIREKVSYILRNPERRWPAAGSYRWAAMFDVF
ncbi:transposase [bacterium]|nr:transposase [bacterium]